MWRQHLICGVALLTLGIGIFIGCACGATLISILLALGFLCCGCFLLRKKLVISLSTSAYISPERVRSEQYGTGL